MVSTRITRLLTIAAAISCLAAVATAPTPGTLTTAGQYAVATMAFAAILWVTGAVPLAVTALCIPILLTAFGVYPDFGDAVAGFADPVIFLLLAGFMLAEALQAHAIDRRIAYAILVRFGTSPRGLVLGVMVSTALLSMIISNTATVAMMVPIVLGIVDSVTDVATFEDGPTAAGGDDAVDLDDDGHVDPDGGADEAGVGRAATAGVGSADEAGLDGAGDAPEGSNLQIAMLLGVAYAASLGGVGTLVGTPPNAIVVGQLEELVGVEITFVQWLAIGLPMVVVTLPVAWVVLTYVTYPPEPVELGRAREHARRHRRELGPLSPAARRTVAIFAATATLWLLGGLGFLFVDHLPAAWHVTLFGGAATSVFGTAGHEGLLFYVLVGLAAVPALVASGAAEWDELLDIDWATLLLLGGGISLANALADTNATRWLAEVAFGAFTGSPLLVVLFVIVALTVLVGELASNTAMAALLAPLLVNLGPTYAAALGTTSELAAVLLAVTGAIAASYGFALPVATPPNAIVYGAGYVRREHMLRAGALLDAVVILLTVAMAALLIRLVWPVVLA